MDVILGFVLFTVFIIGALAAGVSTWIALAAGCAVFFVIALRRRFPAKELLRMAAKGAGSTLIVVEVLIVLGALTASWRSSGTIAFFVYHGVQMIAPPLFLILTFLLSAFLSYALGTSFGVAGTLGVIFMTLARGGGVSPVITGGVLLSGIMVGDRTSPLSSTLILIANQTKTDSSKNSRMLLKSGLAPFLVCTAAYTVLSFLNPIETVDKTLIAEYDGLFDLSPLLLIPVIIVIVLPLLKVNVFVTLSLSTASAYVLSIFLQHESPVKALCEFVTGYTSPAAGITETLNGGGIISMLDVSLLLVISGALTGILNGTDMLSGIRGKSVALAEKIGTFPAMLLVGLCAGAVMCNQVLSVILTIEFFGGVNGDDAEGREKTALYTADSAQLVPAFIPWNVLGKVPRDFFGVGYGSTVYAFYLFLIPLFTLVRSLISSRRSRCR